MSTNVTQFKIKIKISKGLEIVPNVEHKLFVIQKTFTQMISIIKMLKTKVRSAPSTSQKLVVFTAFKFAFVTTNIKTVLCGSNVRSGMIF